MPWPTTTGGGIMGYPSTVDTGLVTPHALYDPDPAGLAANTLPAGAYLVGVTLYAPAIITGVRVGIAAGGNGHYDTGIYDATGTNGIAGNLLAHSAATNTTLSTSSAFLAPAFINGNLSLSPGKYWLAFWIDNATDTVYRSSMASTNLGVAMFGTSAGPLPAAASSLGSFVDSVRKVALFALISGSWS